MITLCEIFFTWLITKLPDRLVSHLGEPHNYCLSDFVLSLINKLRDRSFLYLGEALNYCSPDFVMLSVPRAEHN